MEVLKVSSKSSPNSVAGAIAGVVRESGAVEVQAVGAGAYTSVAGDEEGECCTRVGRSDNT